MIVRIEKLVYNGYGMGRSEEGLILFVPYTAPGDLVKVKIVERKRDFAFAIVEDLLEPSPHRVTPSCPHFGQCGSCQWLHVDYNVQLQSKEEILKRELKASSPIKEIIPSPPVNYRRRVLFNVERKLIGFKAFRSNNTVPIGSCQLVTNGMNKALLELYKFQSVLKNSTQVWIGEDKEGKRLLIDISSQKKIPDIHRIYHSLKLSTSKEVGLRIRYKGKRSLLGKKFLEETLLGFNVRYTFGSFFQANRYLVETLVQEVFELVPEGAKVLELFSGCGTFTLPLSQKVERIKAVEVNPVSCKLLTETASAQGIKNIEVINMDVDRFISTFDEEVDVVFLDPPRTGCSDTLLRALINVKPKKIVYVSCNPTTLARDIRKLEDYDIVSIQPLDMFPNTFHLETVAFLERK
ncbi:23S rRNA (uracil1939-C5)-methyltransferase [Thermosulfidibacter takaii ABI70S6]|uniref:23S rRNA (Uracil1939-C5)-methyltransferase n=1 Tax=Thermosulfidibacter takaii (strain DSM 17441 / JCM 13301 / NBRC 103674 / ABI70S6) TaxID=1298851 RepID=A0A0S3QTS4_THET7|nr:23S rRNA (uracil(1939)-C(5))-methyltransferase RlmD [Thermosulfidibacter takaii]BAT71701.1 23S rRNA (uracil1939-C5)-methyltransferase [Thermosulfidibacter takaii ABI70S6]